MPREQYEYKISGRGPASFRRAFEAGYIPTQECITIHEDYSPPPTRGPSFRHAFYQLKNGRLREVNSQNVPVEDDPHKSEGRNIESVITGRTQWEFVIRG